MAFQPFIYRRAYSVRIWNTDLPTQHRYLDSSVLCACRYCCSFFRWSSARAGSHQQSTLHVFVVCRRLFQRITATRGMLWIPGSLASGETALVDQATLSLADALASCPCLVRRMPRLLAGLLVLASNLHWTKHTGPLHPHQTISSNVLSIRFSDHGH